MNYKSAKLQINPDTICFAWDKILADLAEVNQNTFLNIKIDMM